jgi:hypothetical protein
MSKAEYHKKLRQILTDLEEEHEELNRIIDIPRNSLDFCDFTLQRFKRRKLLLKDKIARIKNELFPDIIA